MTRDSICVAALLTIGILAIQEQPDGSRGLKRGDQHSSSESTYLLGSSDLESSGSQSKIAEEQMPVRILGDDPYAQYSSKLQEQGYPGAYGGGSPYGGSGFGPGGRGGGGQGYGYGGQFAYDSRRGVPMWELAESFEQDVFRFVRVRYTSWGRPSYNRRGRWATDYPDSDLNFSFRLQELTSLKVNPEPLYLDLTDDQIYDYPFLYMIEPGGLVFSPAEIENLERYCLNGGFLMVDDFWGESEWLNFETEIKRVFPDREIVDVPLEHNIFHCVYDLQERPQVPSIHHWMRYGDSSERGGLSEEVHYRAIFDDKERIMVFICHNTDLGDGWEREGESREYFELFSEKKAYPMGINIVFYAMTH